MFFKTFGKQGSSVGEGLVEDLEVPVALNAENAARCIRGRSGVCYGSTRKEKREFGR
jgi:hypothetical protein